MTPTIRLLSLVLLLPIWPSQPIAAQDEPLGHRAAFGVLEAGPMVKAEAGEILRLRADPRSEALIIFDETVELPVLDRRDRWVKTHYRGWTGWLAPDGEPSIEEYEFEALTQQASLIDTGAADRAHQLEGARALLGEENPVGARLGPWDLVTDVRDRDLLARLDSIATQLPATYERRFGLPAIVDQRSTVVLFRSEEAYRRYTGEFTELGGFLGGGHADGLLAALFLDEDPGHVEAVLIHELTHLLNRSSFPDGTTSWLEEGTANDLGIALVDASGRIELGSLGGERTFTAQRSAGGRVSVQTRQTGGHRVWSRLMCDWRRNRPSLQPLPTLLALEWSDFVEDDLRASNYAMSTFLVRFLLDEGSEDRASAFRRFLLEVSQGGGSDAGALASALEISESDLQRRYERWLTAQSVQFPIGTGCTDAGRLRLR